MALLKSLPDPSRIRAMAERSAPDLSRPRLSEEHERALADVERRTAACYASMEELSYQIGNLTEELKRGPPGDDHK